VPFRAVVVIPAYNEEESLPGVLRRLAESGQKHEVVVVDDGSRDRTAEVARAGGATVVAHGVNQGYKQALRTGMRYALDHGLDGVLFMDADGQHRPEYIGALVGRASEPDAPDVVIGSRFVQPRHYEGPLGRRIGMQFFSLLTAAASGRRIWDTTSGMKLLTRRALSIIVGEAFNDFHADMLVFCLVAGLKVVEVPIVVDERRAGTSMYKWTAAFTYPAKTLMKIAALYPRALRARRAI
jgi:glycosyltransferase involved in cell wall biosynthesis